MFRASRANDALDGLTRTLAEKGLEAPLAATKMVARTVRRQAEVLALSDVFLVLTALFASLLALTLLMRRPVPAGGGGGGGH